MARPLRVLARFLTLAAAMAAALVMSWKPLLGSSSAAGLSLLSIILDGINYRQGATKCWPKILDASLAVLWTACSILLFLRTFDWLWRYAGLVILASLSLLSCISACLRRPWVWQVAMDHVEAHENRLVLRQASNVVTLYWALLFALMATGVAVNSCCNTQLAAGDTGETRTLVHPSQTMNLLLGVCWPSLVLVLGARSSERLGRYATKRLHHGQHLAPE
ncbi:Uncharacterized protein SCF082_LOCUS29160 [Durusdinium trenchii]|uniref:Uncharacterized protein n=1 Tax=Durusdinium trenchii TaxID=1381693 RepID=A0ABP0MPZ6_9DINO